MAKKNMLVSITVGLNNRASRGLQAIGGDVKRMSAGMSGNLGGVGRSLDGLGAAATAIVPELALPFAAMNFGAKLALGGIMTLGKLGVGALRTIGRAALAAGRNLLQVGKWAVIAGGVSAFELGRRGIGAAMEMEGHLAKLKVAMKSYAGAVDMLKWAKDFSQKTPFEMSEVVDATTRLQLYGLSAKKWMPLIGDMAGTMNKSITDGVEAVADAVSGGGLERLKEFGVSGIKLKAAGWTGGYQTQQDIDSLKVALESVLKGNFGGGMESMMATAGGAISNFKDKIFAFFVSVGEKMMPAFKAALAMGERFITWLQDAGIAGALGESLGRTIERGMVWAAFGIQFLMKALSPAGLEIIRAWFGGVVAGARAMALGIGMWLLSAVMWARGMYAGVAGFLGKLVGFVQANLPLIGAWLKYFVDMGGFVVAWAYKHLPDLVDLFVSAFSGIGKTILGVQIVWNGLATGFQVVGDVIAAVVITLATVIMGALAVVLETVNLLVKGLNAISFGALDGISKPLDNATKKWSDWTRNMASNTSKMWKEAGKDLGEGAQKDIEIKARLQKFGETEDSAKAWAGQMRQKWAAIPEPKAPAAPKMKMEKWGTAPKPLFPPARKQREEKPATGGLNPFGPYRTPQIAPAQPFGQIAPFRSQAEEERIQRSMQPTVIPPPVMPQPQAATNAAGQEAGAGEATETVRTLRIDTNDPKTLETLARAPGFRQLLREEIRFATGRV